MLTRPGTLLFCALLLHTAQAAETVTRYEMTIAVEPTKIDGKPWDVAGGAPDIAIAVDGQFLGLACRDSYTCTVPFTSNNTTWKIQVYDMDLAEHDLIGYGECGLNQECKLHQCRVTIR